MRAKYSFGVETNSDWTNGLGYTSGARGVIEIAEGENLEVDPPQRLIQSLNALWSDEVKAEGTSRVTWEIEQVEDSCRLTVTHDELREGANGEIYGGWPMILSGLKTLLETGEQPTTPGSLLYPAADVRLADSSTPTSGPGGRARSWTSPAPASSCTRCAFPRAARCCL